MSVSLSCRSFGSLPTGEGVEIWTLHGRGGLIVEAMTYGCIVTRLLAPDRDGRLADIVLGFNDLDSYLAGHPYFGAMAGRVAGRVSGAAFSLDGTQYALCSNDAPNHLHGGLRGFDKKLWRAVAMKDEAGAPAVRFSCTSPDGEEGYPGTVSVAVTYSVADENVFLISTEASTDRPTPFNLTHHSYFNLSGEASGGIADHVLQICADQYVPTDERMTLLGRMEHVDGKGNDLRKPAALGEVIPHLFQGHGDLYRIRRPAGGGDRDSLAQAARLFDPASGRMLTVSTTEDFLQLYTGASLDSTLRGKSGRMYEQHAGVCLECEGYPDGVNTPCVGDIVLRPGAPRHRIDAYAFSIAPAEQRCASAAPADEVMRYAPAMPRKRDFRIGILGSGFIVNDCHLVSYRRAGFNPVAIASRNQENAERVAQRHAIARVFGSYEELLDDASIEVLDIAVPPTHQLELIHAACDRGTVKGILAQKPLALSYGEAEEAVRRCEEAGIELAVNQNMRFDPTVHTTKRLLDEGFLGAPVFATIDMRGVPHWQPWQAETGSATLKIMSIHHLDCMRFWFGDPERVFCSTRPDPRTEFAHTDGICTTILEYENGMRSVVIDDVWTGPVKEGCPGDIRIDWRIEGLDGLAMGDLGWCKDPYTTPSKMRYARKGDADFRSFDPPESWFPDAFAGTMGQLLIALERSERSTLSGRDNLGTMALVEAAARSAQEHRMVEPREITARKNS